MAVNGRGETQFGFSASAPTIFTGAFVTGRQPRDPPGTVSSSALVHAGEDFYIRTSGGPSNRWGDYTGISVDPSSDETFWAFNQFADERGTVDGRGHDGRWGTAWARSRFRGRDNDRIAAAAEEGFDLLQNHPNPFNPSTTVTLTLPRQSEVFVGVYNMLGRQVNGVLPSGRHALHFDAGDLASGVYVLRMRTPKGTFGSHATNTQVEPVVSAVNEPPTLVLELLQEVAAQERWKTRGHN